MSDLHSEFFADRQHKITKVLDKTILPPLDTDADSILVLAGDIGSLQYPAALVTTIDHLAPRFKFVLYVAGNHEHYHSNLTDCVVQVNNLIKHHDNVIFDNFEKIPFEYLGEPSRRNDVWVATLWSDYNKNPIDMLACQGALNDHNHIKGFDGVSPVTANELLEVHTCMRAQLETGVKFGDVVITHHAPSFQSIPAEFKSSNLNSAFASDLTKLIRDKCPVTWLHGHIHNSCDYAVGMTRVVCNPVGYSPNYNKSYNNKLVLEV